MKMNSDAQLNFPIEFHEAWQALPFNIQLMLMHRWRAEQEAAGAYPRVEDDDLADPT
jgi:hypothetical protein